MTVKPSAANVLRIFREATADDVTSGREWYARARRDAARLARILFRTDSPTADQIAAAAAVIAVLSPSTPWARNVALAEQACRMAADGATFDAITALGADGGLGTMGVNARKAAAIVLGADPAAVVSGPKVVPFWHRIAEAGNAATGAGSVVVDRHAFDIAVGRVTDDRTRGAFLGRKGGTHAVALAYVRAASVLRRTGEAPGITPSELQAVTWTTWRREHGHAMAKAQARRDAAA